MSLGLGYLVGCINPAAWIAKMKHVNLKEEGTGNLGATNTAYVMGKKAGYFVLFLIFRDNAPNDTAALCSERTGNYTVGPSFPRKEKRRFSRRIYFRSSRRRKNRWRRNFCRNQNRF